MTFLDKLKLVNNMWKSFPTGDSKTEFKNKIANALDTDKVTSLDGLVQFATMPDNTFNLLLKVIGLYHKGELKGQKPIGKTKKEHSFSSTSLINLQGLSVEERHELLTLVH